MEERIRANGVRVLQAVKTEKGMTKEKRQLFLEELTRTCNVHSAAAHAGVAVSSAYRLRNRDDAFADAWREAMTIGYDRLEFMLLERALDGADAIEPALGLDGADGRTGSDAGAPDDGTSGAPAAAGPRPGVRIERFRGAPADLQLAMWLLNRHQALVERREKRPAVRRAATAEETDAAIAHKLAMLKKYLDAGE